MEKGLLDCALKMVATLNTISEAKTRSRVPTETRSKVIFLALEQQFGPRYHDNPNSTDASVSQEQFLIMGFNIF